ncbi:NusG domain II-containing protein [Hydrogenispora ethanolica]|uniref:NusG domain II-containing protein n=1 Tax=Hydrogenispora ethanolica TaxID=1082276 RepID=UPI0010509948
MKITISIEKGRIRFSDAGCPDRLCVKQGWLTSQGDRAVCLPSKTVILIRDSARPVDSISY